MMKSLLCKIGIHDWTISKWSRFKDKGFNQLSEQGFDRECERCGKRQRLEKPKEYHPTKYVWVNHK